MIKSKRNRLAGKQAGYDRAGMSKESRLKKLAYDLEYQKAPEQVKNRIARNTARQAMIKAGRVKVGDGKDVDHKKALKSGGSNKKSNLRVRSVRSNRGDKTY